LVLASAPSITPGLRRILDGSSRGLR
jgi:hypothetical protein